MDKVQKNKKTIMTALLAGIMAIGGGLLWHNNHNSNNNSNSDNPKKTVVEEEHQDVDNNDTTAVLEQPVAEQNTQPKNASKGTARATKKTSDFEAEEDFGKIQRQNREYNFERDMSLSELEQYLKDLDTTMANLQKTIESDEIDAETRFTARNRYRMLSEDRENIQQIINEKRANAAVELRDLGNTR